MLLAKTVVVVLNVDERTIGNGDNTFARVAVDASEGTHLAHVEVAQAGQLEERAAGSIVNTLVGTYESAVERPLTPTGVHLALAYQHAQMALVEAENDTVNGYEDP